MRIATSGDGIVCGEGFVVGAAYVEDSRQGGMIFEVEEAPDAFLLATTGPVPAIYEVN
jgi:hypothetical protein